MRTVLLTLLALILAGCASTPITRERPISIKEISPRYIETEQFMRIGEYLTGKEHTGRRVIVRSDPTERDGYYFILTLSEKAKKLPRGTKIVAEFYTALSHDVQSFEFLLPSRLPGTKDIFVGLTGSDAPAEQQIPAAWRFTFQAASGEVIAQKQSYLWEL